MAEDIGYKQVPVFASSSNVNAVAKGPLYVNMLRWQNGWLTRGGFGQQAQFDTRLSTQLADGVGFRKVLGSISVITNNKSVQIISVLLNQGVQTSTALVTTTPQLFYSVSIYDVTTNRQHEEVLFVHTSQTISQPQEMMTAGVRWGEMPSGTSLRVLTAVDEEVALVEYDDSVIMTAPNMGVWQYNVVDIGDKPNVLQLDVWRDKFVSGVPLGESSRVVPVVATNGDNTDAVAYIGNDLFPNPTDVEVLNGVLVYASGRVLYFTEPGKPGSIPDTWRVPVNMQTQITAIAQNLGYLYIFGINETWVYQPSASNPAGGQLTQLTDAIGCVGPSAMSRADGMLMWASLRGIHHVGSGPYNIQYISDEIRPYFDSSVSNPLLNYYTASGELGVDNGSDAPQITWQWQRERGYVTMDYDILSRSLFISVPAQNLVIVRQTLSDQSESWHFWTFDTVTWDLGANRPVGVQQNIRTPLIVTQDGKTWLVGGMDVFPAQSWPLRSGPSQSYYICEWRRGGGLDRSSIPDEDMRQFGGQYKALTSGSNRNYVVLDRPVLWKAGTKMPSGNALLQDTWMTPVRMWSANARGLAAWTFSIVLDVDSMVPVLTDTGVFSGDVDYLLGPERWPSRWGYIDGGGNSTVTWNLGTRTLTIAFDSSGVAVPDRWTTWPAVNNPHKREFPVMWIGFYGNNKMGVVPQSATLSITPDGDVPTSLIDLYAWMQPSRSYVTQEDAKAQGVDWLAQGAEVNLDGAEQIRTRGLWSRLITSGKSAESVAVGWPTGLLNLVVSPDWKNYSTQKQDFTGQGVNSLYNNGGAIQSVLNKAVDPALPAIQAIRKRLATGAYNDPDFALFDYAGNLWGEDGTTTGTDYAGDEPYDEMQFSLAVRGGVIAAMLFGHVLNRAESLFLDRAMMLVRDVGNRRRTGR